jgi:hypothetical protein
MLDAAQKLIDEGAIDRDMDDESWKIMSQQMLL